MSEVSSRGPCDKCGSSDNLIHYDDNGYHCFTPGCDNHKSIGHIEDDINPDVSANEHMSFSGDYTALVKRKISKNTCATYSYSVGIYKGKTAQIAHYKSQNGKILARKYRLADKTFLWDGKSTEAGLFGQWLFTPNEKLSIVITEGELDALSLAEIQDCRFPVVSLQNGAQSAKKTLAENMEWLSKFKKIVLCFDQDEAGHKATEECASILPLGKVYIARLPMKDINEMLVANRVKELTKAILCADEYRPDGVLEGSELSLEKLKAKKKRGYSIPFPILDDRTRGLQKGRFTLLTAGVGIGKSTITKEIGYHLLTIHNLKIGNIFLEEDLQDTALSYIAIDNNVPAYKLAENPNIITAEQFEKSYNKLINNERILFYDHFGSIGTENLLHKLEYMAIGKEVDFIILDHISIIISGLVSSREGERKDIDILMTSLRSLIQRTGVGIIAVVHLKRTTGIPINEGGKISITDLRGSGSLEQLTDIVIGIERNQQDKETENVARLKILKNRVTGKTGYCDNIYYNDDTGRLLTMR